MAESTSPQKKPRRRSLCARLLLSFLGFVATQFLPQSSGFGLEATPVFSFLYVVICLLVAVVVGVASSLYPAMSAARTQPIKILREL